VSSLPATVATATIEQGAKSNRVRKVKRTKPKPEPKRYHADRAVLDQGSEKACISMPPAELVELDRVCERAQMNRSHFIRQAVKHYIAKLEATDYGALEDATIVQLVDELEIVVKRWREVNKRRRVRDRGKVRS
jgi:predicted transcriptional regulator